MFFAAFGLTYPLSELGIVNQVKSKEIITVTVFGCVLIHKLLLNLTEKTYQTLKTVFKDTNFGQKNTPRCAMFLLLFSMFGNAMRPSLICDIQCP